VLLALYDQQKEKALFHLEGMFAFAIWDEKEKTLFCARDRFGEKPFFYHQKDNVFYFASEMKALFAANVSKEKNQKKIYNYIQYGNIEDPTDRGATFFKNVFQLEPAHYLIITPDSTTKKQYWDLHIENESNLSEKESIEKFRELFLSSISRRLRSDVPIGSSLSGGLDSSAIVMMIDQIKKSGHIQKTFSARFKNFSKDEGKFMQMVIEKTKVQPHFVYPTLDSVINNFQTIAYHQEEPMGSASVAIQYEVMKLAKENNVKVLLDGQGADEAMAGYKHFWPTYFSQLYTGNKQQFSSELEAYRANHNEEPFQDTMEFKWLAHHPASFKYLSDLKRKYKSANSEYFSGIHPDLVNQYRSEPNPIPKINNLKEKLYFFLQRRGLNELLRYADRNAMANSVEVRLPFLDHNLIEFIFTLPDSMLMHQGWTKYILRKSMENVLPSEITWRKDKI
jgi:asparagine synthase (glutamine-hydrolysing)